MPSMSKVTFYELVPYLTLKVGYSSPTLVRATLKDIVSNRPDLIVNKGRGICKR
jgi:hypothetical protein